MDRRHWNAPTPKPPPLLNTYVRDIKKPVSGTVKIYLNSVLQVSGYSVDHATGIVTFTVAPAGGVAVSADCDFDVPVRFDTDALSVRIDGPAQYVWDSIPVVETRLGARMPTTV